jgi:hypothetical protein
MFYSLLGRLVWNGLKAYLRLKYGRLLVPKPLLAGGTVAVAIGVMLALQRSRSAS